MDFEKYYKRNKTYIVFNDQRIREIVKIVGRHNPQNILDVGCGNGHLLKLIKISYPGKFLNGVDVYQTKLDGISIKSADVTKGLPYKNDSFNMVIAGEIIEHVPDPDFFLREIKRVLRKHGIVVVTTPNLVSWANRIMVLFGIQPFYSETSTEKNLGRYFKILGQGGKVQGHLKIFTHKSLEEILLKEKLKIIYKKGTTFFFPFPVSLIDKVFTRVVSLSSGLIYVARK